MFQSRYLPLMLSALALALLTTACGNTEPEASILPPPATTSVGTDIDDSVMTTAVKAALLAKTIEGVHNVRNDLVVKQ